MNLNRRHFFDFDSSKSSKFGIVEIPRRHFDVDMNESCVSNMTRPILCANTSSFWHIACSRCIGSGDESVVAYDNLQPMFYTMTFIISTFGLLGNFFVILTVLTHIHNRSMTDLFLFNIAVADMVYSGVNIVGEFLALAQDPRSLHESCVSQPLTSLRVLTFAVSMYSLTSLSAERLLVEAEYLISDNVKAGVLFLLWMCCLATTVPLGICANTITISYSISLAILILTLPLLVTVWLNYHIWKSANTQVGPSHLEARSIRTVAMVTGLVVSLMIFWIPYLVVYTYPDVFGVVVNCYDYGRLLVTQRVVNLIALLNPALNPVLFAVFSKNFRQGLKRIFRFLCSCCFEPLE